MTGVMHWEQLLNPERPGSRQQHNELSRSPFHKDYDRIVFSQSFRQLNRKTQVHPLTQNDSIHTRLTHSLEVSCVGRSLGMLAADKIRPDLPNWITSADIGAVVQAACLAHDIGNPPFGHAGEYAIRDWFASRGEQMIAPHVTGCQFQDLCQFEGNAQGFRILTRLEYHPDEGGMRLTYATLGAYLKYPWLPTPRQSQPDRPAHALAKFGVYSHEQAILAEVAEKLGLPEKQPGRYARHPLSYLLEAADDICYALIDLEDGVALGMVSYTEVEPLFLQLVGPRGLPHETSKTIPHQQKLAALRGKAVNHLVDVLTTAFARQQTLLMNGEMEGGLLSYCPPEISSGIEAAKQLAREQIFQHPGKARLELMAAANLFTLLDEMIPTALSRHLPAQSTFRARRIQDILERQGIRTDNDIYQNTMQILDYISGLSDHQAHALALDLQGQRPLLM